MLLLLIVIVVVLGWIVNNVYNANAKAKLIERAIYISRVTGNDNEIRFLCERLETDEELLFKLMQGGGISFGNGNVLVIDDIPEIAFQGNIGTIMIGKKKYELMTFTRNNIPMLRLTEYGVRGSAKAPLELPLRALLQTMVGLDLIKEQDDI